MQTEARIIYERAQLEKMKWYQNEMIRLNSINESAHKIFESANACKNIVYKCRVGLYGKAFKNKKYATDNMELNELINNLVKCIEVYNLCCSRLIYKLDEKSRSVFKIYLLETIDLELKQCVSYLQTLSEKGYKFCIDSELLDTYRDNALEQYNSEWGV